MKPFALAAVLLIAGCASTPEPKTPEQMIEGTWACSLSPEGVSIKADYIYKADGTSSFQASVNLEQQGMAIQIAATGDSKWTASAETIEETTTRMTVTSAKVGPQDMPTDMFQGMLEQMMVNQTVTSKIVTLTDTKFETTDPDGILTTCTR